jgi:hypothetical protein
MFSAVLTCASVETSALSVVVERATLEPVAAQLPPFEVVGGKHAPDLVAGDRRFFQYEYSLRLISDSLFDRDVSLPDLPLTYKVRTTVPGQTSAIEGPVQHYAMPPIAIRILSLVPDTERDIRDTTLGTFSALEDARTRADMFITVGMVVSALGAGLGVLGVALMLIERRRGPRARRADSVSHAAVVRAVRRELAAIRRARASSEWTPALVGRALAALRVLAAFALGRPVTQRRTDEPSAATHEGAIALPLWGQRQARILVSGAVTTENVGSALATPPDLAPASAEAEAGSRRARRLEPIHTALRAFTESQYGNGDAAGDGRLDEGLAAAERLGARLAVETGLLGRLTRQAARLRTWLWAR